MEKTILAKQIKDYCNGGITDKERKDFDLIIDDFINKNPNLIDSAFLNKFVKEKSEFINHIKEQDRLHYLRQISLNTTKYSRENYISLMWIRVTMIISLISILISIIIISQK